MTRCNCNAIQSIALALLEVALLSGCADGVTDGNTNGFAVSAFMPDAASDPPQDTTPDPNSPDVDVSTPSSQVLAELIDAAVTEPTPESDADHRALAPLSDDSEPLDGAGHTVTTEHGDSDIPDALDAANVNERVDASDAASLSADVVSEPDSDGESNAPDGVADAGANPVLSGVSEATPGDLVITEVMFAPSGPEPQSEWFEIYNTTSVPKLLSGLTIEDGDGRTQNVAVDSPVIAPAHAYVVFVNDLLFALANFIPEGAVAYDYGAGIPTSDRIQLQNDVTGGLSLWNGPSEIASVPYGPWNMASFGQSIEFDALDDVGSDVASHWCLAENPWTAQSDDGTPGAANDCP